jgi:hypothetical protein
VVARRYCGARGTHAVTASVYSSNGQSDINGLLLLPPIILTGSMTSEDRCYYRACGTCAIVDSARSSDGMAAAAMECMT